MAEIRTYEEMLKVEKDFMRVLDLKDKIHKLTMQMNGVTCEIGDDDCLNCGS